MQGEMEAVVAKFHRSRRRLCIKVISQIATSSRNNSAAAAAAAQLYQSRPQQHATQQHQLNSEKSMRDEMFFLFGL